MRTSLFWTLLAFCASLASAAIIDATQDTLGGFLKSESPSLVFIYSNSSTRCAEFQNVFNELASSRNEVFERLQFIRVDGPANPKLMERQNINQFPTVFFVDKGKTEKVLNFELGYIKMYLYSKLKDEPNFIPNDAVLEFDDSNFGPWTQNKAALVLFTYKNESTEALAAKNIFATVAKRYKNTPGVVFGHIYRDSPKAMLTASFIKPVKSDITYVFFPAYGMPYIVKEPLDKKDIEAILSKHNIEVKGFMGGLVERFYHKAVKPSVPGVDPNAIEKDLSDFMENIKTVVEPEYADKIQSGVDALRTLAKDADILAESANAHKEL